MPERGIYPAGDRGDSSAFKGIREVAAKKSPDMPPSLRSECSKGYEDVKPGWAGNVKR